MSAANRIPSMQRIVIFGGEPMSYRKMIQELIRDGGSTEQIGAYLAGFGNGPCGRCRAKAGEERDRDGWPLCDACAEVVLADERNHPR